MPRKKQPPIRSFKDPRHPLWQVLQGTLALLLIIYGGDHIAEGAHIAGGDLSDLAPIGGVAIASKLLWQVFHA